MKYRNANIWIMSLLYLSCLVFFVKQTVLQTVCYCFKLNMYLNIMLENETDFEFVFGHFLPKKRKKENKINFPICKETNVHTKTNTRGSFETQHIFNLAFSKLLLIYYWYFWPNRCPITDNELWIWQQHSLLRLGESPAKLRWPALRPLPSLRPRSYADPFHLWH